MTTRNEVIEEMAQVVEAHRYDDEFLNNCGLRREHRADLAQAIRALKTDEPQDDGLVELLGEYWRESRRYIYDKTPERREKVIARFEPRILAALREPQDNGLAAALARCVVFADRCAGEGIDIGGLDAGDAWGDVVTALGFDDGEEQPFEKLRQAILAALHKPQEQIAESANCSGEQAYGLARELTWLLSDYADWPDSTMVELVLTDEASDRTERVTLGQLRRAALGGSDEG